MTTPASVPLWELHGIGHVDRQVVGDIAAMMESAGVTSVIGAWDQYELVAVIDGLNKSGFVLHSVRRLDVPTGSAKPAPR